MALGFKTGGRKKGTPNKRKLLRVEDVLAQLQIDPVKQLLVLVKDGGLQPKDKARIWMELLSYCQAKPTFRQDEVDEDDLIDDLAEESTAKLLELVRGDK